jgi:hypothetical protein
MDKPAEILLFDFLTDRITGALTGDPLAGLELHDTIYQKINTDRGLRISEAVGEILPGPAAEWKEWDVALTIVCFSRVLGKEKTNRQTALIDLFQIQQATCAVLLDDSTLAGRVCDLLLQKCIRGYDSLDGEPYATAHIPIVINPSGARYTE